MCTFFHAKQVILPLLLQMSVASEDQHDKKPMMFVEFYQTRELILSTVGFDPRELLQHLPLLLAIIITEKKKEHGKQISGLQN